MKSYLSTAGSNIRVVTKIETLQALANLESIIDVSGIILVARGDLGAEIELARVPIIQKQIIHTCRQLGKLVIIATQVMESMVNCPTATRTEVSDVANAIIVLLCKNLFFRKILV